MGGIFSKANRPKLAGAYFNFVQKVLPTVPAAPGSVAAIPFVHDWGPLEEVVRVATFAEFQAIYGDSDDTAGYRAVKQAFVGEAFEDRGGAGEVVAYRMGGASAAKATITLQNTTPANALTLNAVYEGSRGNDLRVTTQDHAADPTQDELIIYLGTVEVEKYVYPNTDLADLAAQINDSSDWVTAAVVLDGVALGAVSSQALAAGDDGSSLVAGDWTSTLDALDVESFGVFAPYDLTDGAIVTSVRTWAVEANALGKRFLAVFGGAAGESLATAVTRSGDLADPNIVNLGVGTLTDDSLGADGAELDLSTSELAPRIAGILAARGEYRSLTHARLAGVEIKAGPTLDDMLEAFDEGVVTFARDSNAEAPVHVKTGLTTWTKTDADADPAKPYLQFRNPKYVRTMHGIETDLTQFAEGTLGDSINDATRDALLAEAKRTLLTRQDAGVIQPGWTVGIDQDPPPSPEDEFIALVIGVSFSRSLEQAYFTVAIG